MGQSRNEDALENILGAQNELLPPMSRNEKWLHKILGEEIETEEPQSRIEELLKQISEQGGGGGEFELYLTSGKYSLSDTITQEEKTELNSDKGNVVVAYAENETKTIKTVRISVAGRNIVFADYNGSISSGNYITINFAGTSGTAARKINSFAAFQDGVGLSASKVWFEFYKLKS